MNEVKNADEYAKLISCQQMKTALTLLLLLCYVLSTPVDLSQATITTFAGTGVGGYNGDGPALTTQLDYPGQCVFNADNTIMYCADYSQNRIRAINMATRVITTVGGNGKFKVQKINYYR